MNEFNSAVQAAIVSYDYEGTPVSFSKGDGVMINATEMAKPFGKNVRQWFDNPGTHEFIETLAVARGIAPTVEKRTSLNTKDLAERYPQLVKVVRGGIVSKVTQGTWIHEDIALEFARWLSPTFAIWCNDRIKELLTQGVTTTNDDDATLLNAMNILQRRIEEKAQRLQMAEGQIEEQQKQIDQLAPMADYTREVLQSNSTFTLTQVAKDLGLRSVRVFLDFCHKYHILYHQSNQWLPTAKYATAGYFATRTAKFVKQDGTVGTSLSTVVTETGRQFLHNFYQQKNQQV